MCADNLVLKVILTEASSVLSDWFSMAARTFLTLLINLLYSRLNKSLPDNFPKNSGALNLGLYLQKALSMNWVQNRA